MNYIQEFSKEYDGIEKFTREEFETQEYGEEGIDTPRVLNQIVSDMKRERPSCAIHLNMRGGDARISYISYEMFLPQKIAAVNETCEVSIKEAVKYIKKEFKRITKKTLNLKEKKDKDGQVAYSGRTVEKVSNNERYMYVGWKTYEIDV